MGIASAEGLESLSIGRLATELQMIKTGVFAHFGQKNSSGWPWSTLQVRSSGARGATCASPKSRSADDSVPCGRAGSDRWRTSYFGEVVFAAVSAESDSRPGPV